ncbi:hypothetical protein D3C73_1609370 [compost metagenome]
MPHRIMVRADIKGKYFGLLNIMQCLLVQLVTGFIIAIPIIKRKIIPALKIQRIKAASLAALC